MYLYCTASNRITVHALIWDAMKSRASSESTVKTTVELPEGLWRAAKSRALAQRTDLRSVLIAALAAYLRTSRKAEES